MVGKNPNKEGSKTIFPHCQWNLVLNPTRNAEISKWSIPSCFQVNIAKGIQRTCGAGQLHAWNGPKTLNVTVADWNIYCGPTNGDFAFFLMTQGVGFNDDKMRHLTRSVLRVSFRLVVVVWWFESIFRTVTWVHWLKWLCALTRLFVSTFWGIKSYTWFSLFMMSMLLSLLFSRMTATVFTCLHAYLNGLMNTQAPYYTSTSSLNHLILTL